MHQRTTQVILWLLTVLMPVLIVGCGDDKGTEPEPTTAPVVTTAAVTNITQTTAECGGNITSDGGAAVICRGVCWCTSPTPTTGDDISIDGSGTGNFTSSLSGLTAGTDYYVRAFAINSAGTGYGSVQSFTTTGVTDLDGNVYQTVTIGTQVWMAENLKVTHYRNGDPIPHVTDYSTWVNLNTGAYCAYDFDENYVATYGRLYNFYAVDDSRNIAPAGWHVPSDEEWKQLEISLGLSQAEADASGWRGTDEGGKLKETGTTHWFSPNAGATNESGFTALPGGYFYAGNWFFCELGYMAWFWSSTEYNSESVWGRYLNSRDSRIYRLSFMKRYGCSVRCVRD